MFVPENSALSPQGVCVSAGGNSASERRDPVVRIISLFEHDGDEKVDRSKGEQSASQINEGVEVATSTRVNCRNIPIALKNPNRATGSATAASCLPLQSDLSPLTLLPSRPLQIQKRI